MWYAVRATPLVPSGAVPVTILNWLDQVISIRLRLDGGLNMSQA